MSDAALAHLAFYRFARVVDVPATAQAVRTLARGLLGCVVVAGDGINGMLAGPHGALERLQHAVAEHPLLGAQFPALGWRRTACDAPAFARLKVQERAALLPLAPGGADAATHLTRSLAAREWNALVQHDDVVLLDNRNRFEVRLGRFQGAIDPGVSRFRDMAPYLRAHAPVWKAQGRRLAMYCTGGIRCDATAAWMSDFGLEVYQLDGGILGYLAQVDPAQSLWQGRCFVFDNRIALDERLRPCGATIEDAFAGLPGEAWRIERAQRLAAARAP